MAKDTQVLSSIVAIVAVVGLVMLFGGNITGAQITEVYNPTSGGGVQCAKMLTPAGYVIDCGADIGIGASGFDTPSKQADQFRTDLVQGSFEYGSGVTAYGATSRGVSFPVQQNQCEWKRNYETGTWDYNCWN